MRSVKPIKGRLQITEVFERGERFRKSPGALFVLFKKLPTDEAPRFVFPVSKRTAKKAVVRNRVRRLLKESADSIFKENPDYLQIFDRFALSWRSAPKSPGMIRLSDVKPIVENLFERAADRYYEKKSREDSL